MQEFERKPLSDLPPTRFRTHLVLCDQFVKRKKENNQGVLFATIDARDLRHQVGKRAIGFGVTVALGGVSDTSKIPPLILGDWTIRNATRSITDANTY